MNDLVSYFQQSGEKPSALAKRMGVSPSTVTRVMAGSRTASVKLAKKIEAATDGKVSASSVLGLSVKAPILIEATA